MSSASPGKRPVANTVESPGAPAPAPRGAGAPSPIPGPAGRAAAAAEWGVFLAEAARILGSSVSHRATLRAVASLLVPRFADWCIVDLAGPDGELERVVVAAPAPEMDELARRLRETPPPAGAEGSCARVIRTGEPEVAEITDALLRSLAVDAGHLEALRAVQARRYLCVPLRGRSGVVGSLLMLSADSGRGFGPDDLERAGALAALMALATDAGRLHAAEQRIRVRAERMQSLTAGLSAAVTQTGVGEVVMRDGVVAMGAYAGVIARRTAQGDALEIVASTGYANGCMEAGVRWPTGAPIPVAEAARTGESVFVESPVAWARRYGRPAPAGESAAWAAVPLALEGAPSAGALLWTFDRPRAFSEDDHALLEALGRQAAQALERARLHEAEHRARLAAERAMERVRRLQEVTAALSVARTSDEVARVVVEQGIAALGASAGSIALYEPEAGELRVLRAVGYPEETVERFRTFSLDTPFPLADAVRTGEPVVLGDAAERDARYPHLAGLRRSNGDGAMAAIPLRAEDRVIGAVGLNFPGDVTLGDDDRAFLVALAQQCAQAMERARLFDAERAARAEAEQANQAKARFLSTMSHELRTPLNAIDGYAELMEMELHGPLTAPQREDLARIRRSQRHLLALINDVLFFARMEAGHLQLRAEPVSLRPLLAELEQLLLPQLRARGLTLSRHAEPADLAVRADPDRLRQILLNLVSNAVKFTPAGGHIEVSAARADGEATVSVRDTGIGIPRESLERVFDPFVQLGRDLTSGHEGTGLGLAISRDLARAMGGDLVARSAPGQGATFVLTLAAE